MSPVLGAILTASSIILGAAGLVSLAAAWSLRTKAAAAGGSYEPRARRVESRVAVELGRIGHHLGAVPPAEARPYLLPVTGRAGRDVVDQAADRALVAHGADDTRELHVPRLGQHAAPDRDELLDRLRVGGWPREHLRRHASTNASTNGRRPHL